MPQSVKNVPFGVGCVVCGSDGLGSVSLVWLVWLASVGAVGLVWFVLWSLLVSSTPETHKRISEAEKQYIMSSLKNEVGGDVGMLHHS